MGLFSKKACAICGGDMGRITDNKMADGGICHECARKLSPWFTGLRKTTKEEVEEQLAYREANKEKVAAFRVTRRFGAGTQQILIDDNAGVFMAAKTNDISSENPDVIPLSAVTGCFVEPKQSYHEEKTTDREGHSVSYRPPRFEYSYEIYLNISVNHKYFDKIPVKINDNTIRMKVVGNGGPAVFDNYEYRGCLEIAEEAKAALMSQGAAAAVSAAEEANRPVKCPACGATTVPDSRGCCEYCGAPIRG